MEIIDYKSSTPAPNEQALWRKVRERIGAEAFFCFVCDGIAAISALIVVVINTSIPYAGFTGWDGICATCLFLGVCFIGGIGVLVGLLGIFSRKAPWALLAVLLGVAIIVAGWRV